MDGHGMFYHIVDEKEAFRFGRGGRIHLDFAVVMPMCVKDATERLTHALPRLMRCLAAELRRRRAARH